MISSIKLGQLMMILGQNATEAELKGLIIDVDIEETGSINFEGFVKIINQQKSDHESFFSIDDELKEAFNVFDKNGTGHISAHALKNILTILGENATDEEIANMIRVADFDNDGKVSYKDFYQMMMMIQQPEQKQEEEENLNNN